MKKAMTLLLTTAALVTTACSTPVDFTTSNASSIGGPDKECLVGSCNEGDGDGDNDGDGNTDPSKWFSKVLKVEETKPLVDVLFVIDNSLSMTAELGELSRRFSSFTTTLAKVDWQLCMTTTDAESLQGHLFPISGLNGGKVLTSQTPDFDKKFKDTLASVPRNQDDAEQGIKATNLALRRAFTAAAHGCFRKDSTVAVVIISDEDELNDGWAKGLGRGLDPRADNYPSSVLATVDSIFGTRERFSFNSFSILPNDNQCRSQQRQQVGITLPDGTPAEDATYGHFGIRYAELVQATKGRLNSICSDDYGSKLTDLARGIDEQARSYTLDCAKPEIMKVEITSTSQAEKSWTMTENVMTLWSGFNVGDEVSIKYVCN